MSFNQRVISMCERNLLPQPQEEPLEFGYSRMRIDATNWAEFDKALSCAKRLRKSSVVRQWQCNAGGYYEGSIWVMSADEALEYKGKMKAKMAAIDDWWNRYHEADEPTRKAMACGAIP